MNDLCANEYGLIPTCPHCETSQTFATKVGEIATAGAGRWFVAKVNLELLPRVARRFAASSLPWLIFYHEGHESGRNSGTLSVALIRQFLEQAL